MLWSLAWPESIKKRACRYLLQRYLGNFLEKKLSLDQLSVDIYNGTGSVSDVTLDCQALNELGDSQNWPLEIVDGQMSEISVTIPWSTLLKDDSIVAVNGLSLTVQPKIRTEPVSSMLESMWSSMSSSMQLAADCLKEEVGPQDANPLEGIEMFAHTIDSILSRVKIKFINTKIRIEHVPKNNDRGIALEIHIDNIDYYDEAGVEPVPEMTDPDKTKTYIVSTYTNKKIKFQGVTLYTDEYPSKLRTMSRSLMEKSVSSQASKAESTQNENVDFNTQSTMSDVFYETKSVLSTVDYDVAKDVPCEAPASDYIREPTPEEKANQPEPILFAKILGHQELSVKLKHTEEVEGPKVEVRILLGSFIVFMSPRQLHTLIELVTALNQPHLEDTSNIPLRPSGLNMQCKPMKPTDYQFIEAQLLGHLESRAAKSTSDRYGWSGPGLDDSDNDSEMFHPMTNTDTQMAESYSSVSSTSASMTSSATLPTSQPRIKRNKKVPHIDGDPTAVVSHISLRIVSVSCVLLHKDIMVPTSPGSDYASHTTANKMQQVAKEFFGRYQPIPLVDCGGKQLYLVGEAVEKWADRSHLRLLTSDVTLDGSDKLTSQGSQTMFETSIQHFLLQECLYYKHGEGISPASFDLIHFNSKESEESNSKSNVRLNYKQTSKYTRFGGEKKLVYPVTDFSIKCAPFVVDVELTLIDRMTASFHGGTTTTAAAPSSPRAKNQFNFSLQCPNLDATLRFPIADLRPGVNREIRRVRDDYLVFNFQNSTISCQRSPSAHPQHTTVSLRATALDLFYHENDTAHPTHIARSTMDDHCDGNILRGNTVALPLISLTFNPALPTKGPFDPLSDDEQFAPTGSNPMTTSIYIMNNLRNSDPSPFSAKKMAHQGVTKHDSGPKADQEEELIVPGNEEEMSDFTNSAEENSAVHLHFNLPILSLQLESKQLYEIIYNRINSDLLLWEPQTMDLYDISPHMCGPINPAFEMCKGTGYDSDSGSSTSEEENLYYSTYDAKSKKSTASNKVATEKKYHNFCLTFKVGKGLLTIYAPVRDSNKLVVPGQMGELVLEAHKLSMCHVSGLKGKPKTAQMCLRSGTTKLFHEAILTIPSEKPTLRTFGTVLPASLKKTIYPSGKGVAVKDNLPQRDMFTMALKVEPDCDTPNLKTICVALGIDQATLRHRGDKGIAWLNQLMDVLDVWDYPVPGYTPSTVLSELHVNVCDCAVDYRPLYLPIRTVLTLGNFNVSSNIIAATNTSCLRFLAEECTLHLAYLHGTKPNVAVPLDDDKLPNLQKDYICVLDFGLFELSLRMEDKTTNSTKEQPQVDLSASNDMVNLYTCWDSASALCHLLTYVASDGDSQPPIVPTSRHTSICSDQPLEPLVGLDDRPVEEIRELSPSEIQQVNDLMEEALKESPNTTHDHEDSTSSTEKEVVEVFYFPDESNAQLRQQTLELADAIDADNETKATYYDEYKIDASDDWQESKSLFKDIDSVASPKSSPDKAGRQRKMTRSSGEGSNTDDEYCIIEDLPYSEDDDDLAEPIVRWLVPGPVEIIENHFSKPAARADVLDPPKNFPLPVLKYKLCEMSVTWNIFGGNDFRQAGDVLPAKKNVTIDETRKQGSPTMTKRDKDYEPYDCQRVASGAYRAGVSGVGSVRWAAGSERARAHFGSQTSKKDLRMRGGSQRDHNTCVKLCLTKVKFVHETYPASGKEASRHTLAITKVEVLDRLVCSDINKMLSQYKLKGEPERTHAHMVVVKAAHLRSEPALTTQECCLKVSLLPLRFNLDQDTLAFLVSFFTKLGTEDNNDEDTKSLGGISTESSGSKQTTPTHRPPVMGIASHLRDPPPTPTSLGDADALSLNDNIIRNDEPLMETYEAERLVSENLIQLEEDFNRLGVSEDKPAAKAQVDSDPVDDSPIYFRRVVFSPEVPIRLDYVGKRVDLSAGPVAGLLMGLGQLNCSELELKRLDCKLGLLGLEKLVHWALHEWLSDIKRNQLPGLLSGIGPMHSLLQLITGIRDLVWLPVEQWRRDGRVVTGLRRGAASFTARTAVAALDITTRLLHLIQATAETAFEMLTPSPPLQLQAVFNEERRERRRRRRRDSAQHPQDIREGVTTAYNTVKEGIAETAGRVAMAARLSSGSGVGVLRHVPGAAVAPLALAAAGAADVLSGVRAHLAPHTARDHADKWRTDHDYSDTDTPDKI